jgi:D-alanyl-D-alanine carboxypeptidase
VTYPKLPKLKEGFEAFPSLSAQAALAVDVDSGVALYEKNSDTKLLPASTTKIITALVTLESKNPDDVITATPVSVEGQKLGIFAGEELTVTDLLYSLLVYSANDAAEVLAASYCGTPGCGREAFISAMNEKARELSLTNSHFVNPAGLDSPNHYSTARDLVRAAEVAMENNLFAKIVGTKDITISSVEGKFQYKLQNINALLGEVDGVLGVKTGWTENARENLVTFVDRDGRRVMMAVLGSQDRFGETKKLINWIYENYNWEEIVYNSGVSTQTTPGVD